MVIILLITLLILVAGLAVEIGITSWSIRRASRYQRQKDAAEDQVTSMKERVEHTSEKFRSLDKYATDISWLLSFLYNRYDKFSDIDKEIEEGVDKTGETSIPEEDNKRLQNLKRAIKIVKVTVRASEKIDGFLNSIATQITSIIRDLEADDEEKSAENEGEMNTPKNEGVPALAEEPTKAEGQE